MRAPLLRISGLSIFLVTLLCGSSLGNDAEPLFVVYGTMFTDQAMMIPIDGGYTVIVDNASRQRTIETSLGTGMNAGRFCAVFIDYSGGDVVGAGDEIVIRARCDRDNNLYLFTTHRVEPSEVQQMRAQIDIYQNEISAQDKTWGAIKSLFQ